MRLLFLSNLFPSSVEPTRATYNLNLMRGLREAGHEIQVVAPIPWIPFVDRRWRHRQLPPRIETVDGFKVLHPRYFYTPGFCIDKHHLFYRRAVAPTLRDLWDNQPVDGAILGFVYPDAQALADVCRQRRMPYAVRVNGSDFILRIRQKKFSAMIGRTLRQAPAVVCPGRKLAQAMSELAGVPAERIHPFNNGIDTKVFFPAATRRPARIAFVGNMVGVKRPERTLAAFGKLAARFPAVGLDLIGDGPLRKALKMRAQAMGLGERVTFHGRQSPEAVACLMRASTCLCLSSESEGMPNVVLEALACGTPVVATAVGEIPWLIADGDNGLLVGEQPHEEALIDDLSEKLATALTTDWQAERIAKPMAAYTWTAAARIVEEALSRLCG